MTGGRDRTDEFDDLTGRSREEMIFDKAKLLSVYDQTKDFEPMRSKGFKLHDGPAVGGH